MNHKPFLLLQSRPEDVASDNEYDGFLQATGLSPDGLARLRVEASPFSNIKLDQYSGIIIGGGPFNASDPEKKKTDQQKRVEADFARLLDNVVEKDFPLFGACYGIGTLGTHQGGIISRKYGEQASAPVVTLTDEGRKDPLLAGLPDGFAAIVAHKEACEILPKHAVLLASTEACPVQMFRIKHNLYATQFHPELDLKGLEIRLEIYKHAGYFPPEDKNKILDAIGRTDLSHPKRILQNFVKRYMK